MFEKIDYQVKQDELLKEQEFLNTYGVHKPISYENEEFTQTKEEER